MQPTKTPIEARKFPSPREDLGGSNLYENRNWRHAEFVSVPSRGFWGANLARILQSWLLHVSVPSRGLGGLTERLKIGGTLCCLFPSPLEV